MGLRIRRPQVRILTGAPYVNQDYNESCGLFLFLGKTNIFDFDSSFDSSCTKNGLVSKLKRSPYETSFLEEKRG